MIIASDLETFNKTTSERTIVAVGAGKQLISGVKDYGWKIAYAVDSDKRKWECPVDGLVPEIMVHSWDYLIANIKKTDVLLITVHNYIELLEIIRSNSLLNGCDCYIFTIMKMLQYDSDRRKITRRTVSFRQRKERLIPKKIHYFWFSGDPYPKDVEKCLDSWKKYCPEYEIIKWDLSNYDYTKHPFVEEAIKEKKWQFASDYARGDVIYHFGGIYLDTDVEIIRNIDELLYHEAFIGFESNMYVDPGSGFGACPYNPVIKAFCDEYADKKFVLSDGSLNMVTCPKYYTKVLRRYGLNLDGSYQLLENIAVYPYIYFCPHSHVTGVIDHSDVTYSIHHHAGSWLKHDKRVMDYSRELIHSMIGGLR